MKIYILSFTIALFMSGCSYFTLNATMCEQIAADPNQTIPKECRVYNEEEATKAFKDEKNNAKGSDEESVEFNK
jgi:uncharacterized protein YceK